jgi:predicted nucleic acid-binding protein
VRRYLDASVIVRHLLGIPLGQAERATALIRSGTPLWVIETALLESAFVLEKLHAKPREEVVDALVTLLREPSLQFHGAAKATVVQGLLLCRPSRHVSFGDALGWAAASEDSGTVYTFDRRFPSSGITVLEP